MNGHSSVGNVKRLSPELATNVEERLANGSRILIEEDKRPRNPVPPKPAAMDFSSVNDMIKKDLEQTGANADEMSRVVEESTLGGGLMDINDWIDQTLAARTIFRPKKTVKISS